MGGTDGELRIDIERLLRILKSGDRRLYEVDSEWGRRAWPHTMTIRDGRVLIHRGTHLVVDTPLATIQVRERSQ